MMGCEVQIKSARQEAWQEAEMGCQQVIPQCWQPMDFIALITIVHLRAARHATDPKPCF